MLLYLLNSSHNTYAMNLQCVSSFEEFCNVIKINQSIQYVELDFELR